MLRLKSIRIDKLRKVQPGTVLNFTGDTNLVLGKNGVGKTTLLEVIACATKLEFSAFENEEIDVTVELNDEDVASLVAYSLKARIQHIRSENEVSAVDVIREMPHPFAIFVEVSVALDASTIKIQIANNKVVAIENNVQLIAFDSRSYFAVIAESLVKVVDFLLISKRFDAAEVFGRVFAALISRNVHCRLDESLDVIRAGMVKAVRVWLQGTIKWSTENVSKALIAGVTADSKELAATSRDVNFLREFAQLVEAELVETKFYRQRVDVYGEERKLTFHNQNFFITREESEIDFEKFSYGQKRLLAILQYLAGNEEVVVADEITNGLHHEWIEFIVKKLEGRQCFLTSQNPVLLDFLTFTSAAETKNRLIRCEHGLNGTLIWRNLTDEEANDFYTSYETGMQHVGEIMLKQGLW